MVLRTFTLQVRSWKILLMIGDIATFPYAQQGGKYVRIEHWDVAINHGRAVANHIMRGESFEGIHY